MVLTPRRIRENGNIEYVPWEQFNEEFEIGQNELVDYILLPNTFLLAWIVTDILYRYGTNLI